METDKACHREIDSSTYSLRKIVDNSVEKTVRHDQVTLAIFNGKVSESLTNSMFFNI